jgi:L-lactate dehydrogenase complex protein LldE
MMSNLPPRESPKGKPVSLFVTCLVDLLFPETGMSVVQILQHLGIELEFPEDQTCCGQPAYNGGYHQEAKKVARQFLKAFETAQVIVTPSGSCASMVRVEYLKLFADDPEWLPLAERASAITWEFTEFIVDGLGITDLGARLPETQKFAFHDSCHGLRHLGLGRQARRLVEHIENAHLEEIDDPETCCGFGGLFSIKMADISGAMLENKINAIAASPAQSVVSGDVSCMMHINGGLERQGKPKQVRHIADILAAGLRGHS